MTEAAEEQRQRAATDKPHERVGADTRPLRRNRDFNLLWVGQVISDLGAGASGVAFPLLVLALTGSPARAGLVGFVELLPLPLVALPAGAMIDRVDRRRVLIGADLARLLAMGSLVGAIWLHRVTLAHILVVAFLGGTGWVVFWIAENAALRQVVPET